MLLKMNNQQRSSVQSAADLQFGSNTVVVLR